MYNSQNRKRAVPPKINYLVPSTKLEVTKGASIKLECKATGNPEPVISWSRKVSTRHDNILTHATCIY